MESAEPCLSFVQGAFRDGQEAPGQPHGRPTEIGLILDDEITSKGVVKYLQLLGTSKAAYPERIYSAVIKPRVGILGEALRRLDASLDEGKLLGD